MTLCSSLFTLFKNFNNLFIFILVMGTNIILFKRKLSLNDIYLKFSYLNNA